MKLLDQFAYHVNNIPSNESDVNTNIGEAWIAVDTLSIIWKSNFFDKIKRDFFQNEFLSVIRYGCTMMKKLDGNYTRMLGVAMNKSKKQHSTKHQLYGFLPLISQAIRIRQTRHDTGHSWRSKDALINDIILCISTHWHASVNRQAKIYMHKLCADTGYNLEYQPGAMDDRNGWRESENTVQLYGSMMIMIPCKDVRPSHKGKNECTGALVSLFNCISTFEGYLRPNGPVDWGCRIHRLHLCWGVRLPQRVSGIWH